MMSELGLNTGSKTFRMDSNLYGNKRIRQMVEINLIFSLKTLVAHILPQKVNLINLSVNQ